MNALQKRVALARLLPPRRKPQHRQRVEIHASSESLSALGWVGVIAGSALLVETCVRVAVEIARSWS